MDLILRGGRRDARMGPGRRVRRPPAYDLRPGRLPCLGARRPRCFDRGRRQRRQHGWGSSIIGDLRRAGVGVDGIEVSTSSPTALWSRSPGAVTASVPSSGRWLISSSSTSPRYAGTGECSRGRRGLCRRPVRSASFGVKGTAEVLGYAKGLGKTTLLDTGGDPMAGRKGLSVPSGLCWKM